MDGRPMSNKNIPQYILQPQSSESDIQKCFLNVDRDALYNWLSFCLRDEVMPRAL